MRRLSPVWFPNNAIMRAERSHQGLAITTQRRWRRYVQRVVIWFMLTIGMILFWGEVAGALTKRDASPIGQKLGVLTIVFIAYVVIWHFSLMFRTLALAANSITREKQSGSWDLLVLTGVDAQQIVRGKWWATIQQQFPHYVWLGVFRACAAVYWMAANSRLMYGMIYSPYYSAMSIEILLPAPLGILVAGLIVFGFTIVNLFFTAACGIQASAQTQRPVSALIWAILARAIVPLTPLIGIACVAIGGLYRYTVISGLATVISGAGSALVDNGVSVIYEFVAVKYLWNDYVTPTASPVISFIQVFTTVILALSIYALFTVLLIQRAERLAVNKAGALPLDTSFVTNYKQVTP